jgi:hypothetical protein
MRWLLQRLRWDRSGTVSVLLRLLRSGRKERFMRRNTTSSRVLSATVALTASLALAACGSSTPTTAATTTVASLTSTSASAAAGATTTAAASATTTKATSPTSGKVPAACDLVTKAEAEAVLGVAVDPGTKSEDGSSCEYFPVDPFSAGATTGVTVQTDDAAAFNHAKGSGPALQATVTPVSGLGNDAFLFLIKTASGTTFSQQLQVLKGSNSIVVTVRKKGASDDDVATLEKSVAAKVLPRLP